jgi:hypothetical protein|tara:strand:+ start:9311 stop:9493 length:183 start_codon:yes stop_codon:yes gene_type:complete
MKLKIFLILLYLILCLLARGKAISTQNGAMEVISTLGLFFVVIQTFIVYIAWQTDELKKR